MNKSVAGIQIELCKAKDIPFSPCAENSKVGISENVKGNLRPINGLRHSPEGDTNGWYIWAGEVLSKEEDFFKPLHVEHIIEWCPEIVKFLGLPPGWRFLMDGDYEDIWFNENLLQEIVSSSDDQKT